jgi:lipopolysaccharide export system permease protein
MVLLMQFFWLWIDDFVGKGLSIGVIAEFIWYKLSTLVLLALPLSVLLASLMTFGNLGESFELVAIKSSGISLLRFMRPVFIIAVFLCVLAFLFANNIMPVAELKSRTLLGDVVHKSPAFQLQEGVFYDQIKDFAIKVGKKEKDSLIYDVVIFERGGVLQDNFVTAKSGVMRVTDNRRYLEMTLKDGWRYEERGDRFTANSDYIRVGFKEYKKQFDIASIELLTRTSDTIFRQNEMMLNMKQLAKAQDSIHRDLKKFQVRVKTEVLTFFPFGHYMDSTWTPHNDSSTTIKKFEELLPDSVKSSVNQRAANLILSAKSSNDLLLSLYNSSDKSLRLHKIEWHNKITVSIACLVLLLIGAPLGSIIRKGGFGTPMIFALVFFLVYYFGSNTGRKFAKEGAMSPFTGMWLATFILLPIGIFLVMKAMNDSQLFNKEFYFRVKNNLRKLLRKEKPVAIEQSEFQ